MGTDRSETENIQLQVKEGQGEDKEPLDKA